ncbi:helix-turn-helix domain-containing protein [Phenylobacterium sp.]|uniref:helix-turn-helix domain-containing protein n=1 Tax=Phenylobacterium sp. TaxID=1871053 RepID=UPI0035244833
MPVVRCENLSTLAVALRRRRSEPEFSGKAAARMVSVSERTLRAWETGRSTTPVPATSLIS